MDPFHEFFPSHMSPGSLLAINRYNTSLAFLLHGHMSPGLPKPVLRIHDILVRGSMPLTDGSGSSDLDPDSAIFIINLQVANKKQFKIKMLFCLLLFEGTGIFTSIFKDKKSKDFLLITF